MKGLSRRFLIVWYLATGLYAGFLIATLPRAIHTLALQKMSYPVIDMALQDLVAIMAAIYLPFLWVYAGGKSPWRQLYRVGAIVFFGMLIIGFLMLDIQYAF